MYACLFLSALNKSNLDILDMYTCTCTYMTFTSREIICISVFNLIPTLNFEHFHVLSLNISSTYTCVWIMTLWVWRVLDVRCLMIWRGYRSNIDHPPSQYATSLVKRLIRSWACYSTVGTEYRQRLRQYLPYLLSNYHCHWRLGSTSCLDLLPTNVAVTVLYFVLYSETGMAHIYIHCTLHVYIVPYCMVVMGIVITSFTSVVKEARDLYHMSLA
jgi:hypothetical protein